MNRITEDELNEVSVDGGALRDFGRLGVKDSPANRARRQELMESLPGRVIAGPGDLYALPEPGPAPQLSVCDLVALWVPVGLAVAVVVWLLLR